MLRDLIFTFFAWQRHAPYVTCPAPLYIPCIFRFAARPARETIQKITERKRAEPKTKRVKAQEPMEIYGERQMGKWKFLGIGTGGEPLENLFSRDGGNGHASAVISEEIKSWPAVSRYPGRRAFLMPPERVSRMNLPNLSAMAAIPSRNRCQLGLVYHRGRRVRP